MHPRRRSASPGRPAGGGTTVLCWHLTLASDGRLPLFHGDAGRRAAVRALARACGEELVLACVVDDHVHAVIRCHRRRAGQVAWSVLRALRAVAAAPVEPARVREVDSRSYAPGEPPAPSAVRWGSRPPSSPGR